VSIEDYALNLVLVALVVRQLRGKKLTIVGLLWPVALVLAAGAEYLRGIPTAGSDLPLVLVGALTGAALGLLCAACTRIAAGPDATLIARATGVAAVLWVLGVGARLGFGIYAENGGGPVIERFSARHDITSAQAWTACLLLMSLAEVLGRTALLAIRVRRFRARTSSPSLPPHVHEPAVVALEGDGDDVGRPVAVLGDDEVGLPGTR
jgi:hypothetical protein